MPLSEQEMQRLRDEEYYRAKVREEMNTANAPSRGVFRRISAFAETKLGFWLVTSVLATSLLSAATAFQNYLHRGEAAARERAERFRADTELIVKLSPMLLSDNAAHKQIAFILLQGLADARAADASIVFQIQSTVEFAVKSDPGTAAVILPMVDQPPGRTPDTRQVAAAQAFAHSTLAASIDTASLPIRIYVQAGRSGLSRAETAKRSLEQAGFVMPGIERMEDAKLPLVNSVRYCRGKVSDDALDRVMEAAAKYVSPPPQAFALDPKLCSRVSRNLFELWFTSN